jgi:DsbC/DsbD-like thiol-disulfide interchange protein
MKRLGMFQRVRVAMALVAVVASVCSGSSRSCRAEEVSAPARAAVARDGSAATARRPVVISARFSPGSDDRPALLCITAKIAPGWHVYSITQPVGGPQRTKIALKESAVLKLAGEFHASPKPKSHVDDAVWKGLEIEEHYGKVHWVARLTIPADVDPSTLKVAGTVSLQACAESCLPLRLGFTARLDRDLPAELAKLRDVDLPAVTGKRPPIESPSEQESASDDDDGNANEGARLVPNSRQTHPVIEINSKRRLA